MEDVNIELNPDPWWRRGTIMKICQRREALKSGVISVRRKFSVQSRSLMAQGYHNKNLLEKGSSKKWFDKCKT